MTPLQYRTPATRAPAHAAGSPCVPVLLCWHRLQPWGVSPYMRAQGYNVFDSNTTRILPTLQLQVRCNPTSTHIRHKLNSGPSYNRWNIEDFLWRRVHGWKRWRGIFLSNMGGRMI